MKIIKKIARYWCGTYNEVLGPDGFLCDPNSKYSFMQSNIFSLENITQKACVLLSNTIHEAQDDFIEFYTKEQSTHIGDIYCYFDLSSYSDEYCVVNDIFKAEYIDNWKKNNSNLYLFIGNIDICKRYIKTISRTLIREIENLKEYKDRLYIRTTSSSGLWDITLEKFFSAFWGSEELLRLSIAPYTREQISKICRINNIEEKEFFAIIADKELQSLAITPITLNCLLCSDINKIHNKQLSLSELYYNCYLNLCNDSLCVNDTISPNKMLAIASRIAAIMVFCKKGYISLDNHYICENNYLCVSDIFEESETTGAYSFSIIYNDIIQTIRCSGLFYQTSEGVFTFYHQIMQDYLAARFIINHEFDKNKIISLFTNSKDSEGKLYEWVRGTCNWMQKITPKIDILDYFVSHDPLNILGSDMIPDNDFKEKLVSSILDKFDKYEIIDDDWTLIRNNGEKLNHPNIVKQITPYITDKRKGFLVRRNAISIAEACLLIDLELTLWNIVQDVEEPIIIRESACSSLCCIVKSEQILNQMKSYIQSDISEDVNDEIKGHILKILWEKEWIASEDIFANLTLPKRRNYFGTYDAFLQYYLPNSFKTVCDLENALIWILHIKWANESHLLRYSCLKNIISQTVHSCWKRYVELNNKDLFAQIILLFINNHLPIYPKTESFLGDSDEFNCNTISRDIRLDVADKILLSPLKNHYTTFGLFSSNLILQNEFESVVEFVLSFTTIKEEWKSVLLYFDYSDKRKREFLKLSFPEESNGMYEHIFDSKNSKQQEEMRQKEQRRETKEQEKGEKAKIKIKTELVTCINKFEETHEAIWWSHFYRLLGNNYSNGNYYEEILSSDVVNYENWQLLTDEEKKRVVNLSKLFIEKFTDEYAEYLGKNTYLYHAGAGYKSLILILSVGEEGFINNLDVEILCGWKYIILDYLENSSSMEHQKRKDYLVSILFQKASIEINRVIKDILLVENNRESSYLHSLRFFEESFDCNSQEMLFNLLNLNKLTDNARRQIITLLLDKIPINAIDYIKIQLWSKIDEQLKIDYLGALFNCIDDIDSSKSHWDFVFQQIGNDTELEKKCYLSSINSYSLFLKNGKNLNEKHLAELYGRLYTLFSPEEDPKFDCVHPVSPRESIGYFRDNILGELRNRGTKESIDELQQLQQKLPNAGIEFSIITAKDKFRNLSFEHISPAAFQKLAHNGQFRIISNGDDLLMLIEESLLRLNHILQGSQPMVQCLWDMDKNRIKALAKDEEHLSNYIATHLRQDLEKYAIIPYREAELRKKSILTGTKSGEKVDILVDYNLKNSKHRVIIEVKGSWNSECKTNMEAQLYDRYMETDKCSYGLYVIGWYIGNHDKRNGTSCKTIEEAVKFYEDQAQNLSKNGTYIKSFILDCRLN